MRIRDVKESFLILTRGSDPGWGQTPLGVLVTLTPDGVRPHWVFSSHPTGKFARVYPTEAPSFPWRRSRAAAENPSELDTPCYPGLPAVTTYPCTSSPPSARSTQGTRAVRSSSAAAIVAIRPASEWR